MKRRAGSLGLIFLSVACFSPDGNILFANIFGDATPGSGMTYAITGPRRKGPL